MPTIIAAGITALIPTLSASTALVIAQVGLYAATTVASYFINLAMQPKEKTGTKLQMMIGADVEQSMMVGKSITAGSLIYAGSWGPTNMYLTQVFCVSDVSCDSMTDDIIIDGRPFTINSGFDFNDGGNLVGHPTSKRNSRDFAMCWVKHLDGSQAVADAFLRDKFGGKKKPWKSTMIGKGRSLIVVTTKYDKKEPQSLPQFRFIMKGIRAYNFKLDSTNGGTGSHRYNNSDTWEYENNPANLIYHFSRGYYWYGDWVYGGRAWPKYLLDNDSFTASVNKCNDLVSLKGGGTERRFVAAGEILFSTMPLDTLDELKVACNGRLAEVAGVMHMDIGVVSSPIYTIHDGDVFVNDGRDGRLQKPFGDVINTVTGVYTELKNGGNAKPLKARTKAQYINEDAGQTKPMSTSMRLVTSHTQAQRLTQSMLREARRDLSRQIILGPSYKDLRPGNVIAWESDTYQYDSKDFVIGDILLHSIGGLVAEVREVDPEDEDWIPVDDEDDFLPGDYEEEDLPVQIFPVSFSADTVKNNAGVSKKAAIKATWLDDPDTPDADRIRIQIRLLDTEEFVYNKTVDFDELKMLVSEGIIRNEAYECRAKLVPYTTARDTDWTTWVTITANDVGDVFDDTPPADLATVPTMTLITRAHRDGKVVQKLKVDIDLTGRPNSERYRIRVVDTTEDPDELENYPTDEFPRTFQVQANHTYVVRVVPVSKSSIAGNPSSPATGVTMPIPKKGSGAVPVMSSLAITVGHKRNTLDWDEVDQDAYPDWGYSEIQRSNDAGFSTGLKRFRSKTTLLVDGGLSNASQRWYRGRHVDTSGNESAWSSSINTTTLRLVNDDYNDGSISEPKTDQTLPGTPAAPTLTTLTADLDGDGTVDTGLVASITAPSGVQVVAYEIQRYASATLGGTYTARGERFQIPAEDPNTAGTVTTYDFKANQSKFWKIRTRAIGFNGKKGAWSAQTTTGLQPLQYSTAVQAATGLTVTPVANGFDLAWVKCTDKNYKETIIFVGGVEIKRVKGSAFTDMTVRTISSSYNFTVQHVDSQDRVGTISSTVAGTYRAAIAGEIGTQAITPVKLYRGTDGSNIAPDNDMFEGSGMWPQGAGGGTPTRVRNTIVGASSEWAMNQAITTTIKEIYSVSFPVKGGKTYAIAATLGPLTAVSCTSTLIINWYSLNPTTGALVFISSSSLAITGTTQNYIAFLAKAPAGATRSQLIARIAAGPNVGLWYSDPMVRRATEAELLASDSVTDDKRIPRDHSNMVRNPNADILALWTGSGGTLTTTPSADVSESSNTLSLPANTAAMTISTLSDIPVKGGKVYYIAGALGTTNGQSAPCYLQILFFSMNSAGVQTFINAINTPIITGAGVSEHEGTIVAPANSRRAILRAGKNVSGTAADLVFYGGMVRKAIEDSQTDQTAPGTPAAPSLNTLTADIDGDGTVDTGLTLSVIQPAGVKVTAYEIERHASATLGGTYTQKGERFQIPAEDPNTATTVTSFWFKANQSKFWKVRARAIAYNGKKGSWGALTATGVQPLQYSTAVQAATGLTVTPIARGFELAWAKCTDKNYKETIIAVAGVEIKRVKGSSFADMTVRTIASSYTFTVQHVDSQDRVGTVSSGVAGTYRNVLETDTDDTATNAPSMTLASLTADIDGDGTIDTGLTMVCTLPGAGVKVQYFDVAIYRSTTLGGTYTYWKSEMFKAEAAGTTTKNIKANRNFFYKTQVRGISFKGKEGTFSSLTTPGVQPNQYTGTVQAATGLAVTPISNGFEVSWARCTDVNYGETIIFVGGVEVKRVKGNRWTDLTPRTVDTSYTYTVQHLDTQGRSGTVSSGVAGVYRQTIAAEIKPKAVLASKVYSFGGSNIMPDYEMVEQALWSVTERPLPGTEVAIPIGPNFVQSINPTVDARGFSDYKFRLTSTAVDRNLYLYSPACAIIEGASYFWSMLLENIGTANITQVNFFAYFYRLNSSGGLDFVSSATIIPTVDAVSIGNPLIQNAKAQLFMDFEVPNGVSHVVTRLHISSSLTVIRDVYVMSPVLMERITAERMHPKAVLDWGYGEGTNTIPSSSSDVVAFTLSNAAPIGGPGGRQLMQVRKDVPVTINFRMKNNSGGGRTLASVQIRELDAASAITVIVNSTNVYIDDNSILSDFITYFPSADKLVDYDIYVTTGGASATLNAGKISAQAMQYRDF